ncbi:hypothetical protein D9M73_125230 [compost metagenome]
MPHIGEHLARGGADVDLVAIDAKRAHQRPGVAFGVIAGGKARHGESEDAVARQAQPVHRLGRDDQRMRRIEPARYTDDEALGLRRLKALEQPFDLDVERLIAIGIQFLGRVGDEREAAGVAQQADVAKVGLVREGHAAEALFGVVGEARGIVEGADAHPLLLDSLGIDIGEQQAGRTPEAARFGKQLAQFMHHRLAVPREIGGAFPRPGGGKDISAHRARRLRGAQQCALTRLADDDVGG